MKPFLLATCLALAGGAPVFAADYNLHLEEAGGLRTLIVVNAMSGAVAVATGDDELHLIEDDAARSIMAAAFPADPCNVARAAEASPAKIVIHKMNYDEDPVDVRSEKQVRLQRRDRFAAPHESADSDLTDAPEASYVARAGRVRTVRVLGADREEAARFIESAGGLGPDEIAAIEEAVGL